MRCNMLETNQTRITSAAIAAFSIIAVIIAAGCSHPKVTADQAPDQVSGMAPAPTATPQVEERQVSRPNGVGSPLFFAFDQADLDEQSLSILSNVAHEMKMNSREAIVITGSCDERGSVAYNLKLGMRRGNAAKAYLVRNGISATRIIVKSIGKGSPVATGHNEQAWALNRRDALEISAPVQTALVLRRP